MKSCSVWTKRLDARNVAILMLLILLLISITFQFTQAQVGSTLQDRAVSFLGDVLQLDLASYRLTANEQYNRPDDGHLFYNLESANANDFPFINDGNIIFVFYNGTIGSCRISPGLEGIVYAQPALDRFNRTLNFLERYQIWANDSQIKTMVNLLREVGSEKNASIVSGDLSLRIRASDRLTEYKFSNHFNGVDYSGLSLFYGNSSGYFSFINSRAFYQIGDIRIKVSQDQAIEIAREYLRTYSYNSTLGNGTKVTVSDLNITGVYSVYLDSQSREDSTLYPYWTILYNVSNMPAPGLQGMGVKLWANDGSVFSAYPFTYPFDSSLLTDLFFFPVISSMFTMLAILIAGVIGAIVVLVLVLMTSHGRSTQLKDPEK